MQIIKIKKSYYNKKRVIIKAKKIKQKNVGNPYKMGEKYHTKINITKN
jgi:hypothetical protein